MMIAGIMVLSAAAAGDCPHTLGDHPEACCETLRPPADVSPAPRGDCPDEHVIDLLWICTEEALAAAGSIEAVRDACDFAVDDANITFANSNLPFLVRTVGLRMTDYVEGDNAYLYHIQNPSDGHMDEVPLQRNALAADIVALITYQGYCGVAFVAPNNPAWGYQADSIWCLIDLNPFRHELGHNLGSKHWSQDSGGYFPWSAGHVLTLGDGSQAATAMGGNSIAHFSNPDVLYEGVPTGIEPGEPGQADNHSAFTVTAPMVADFRCRSTACRGDVDLDGTVGADDLLQVLNQWGECPACTADVAYNGAVDVDDLLLIVSTWGNCDGG